MVGRLGPELSTVRAFPLGERGATGVDPDDFNEFLDDAEVNDSEELLDQADEAEAASR